MDDLLGAWHCRLRTQAAATDDGDGAHDVDHLDRVWRTARTLLAEYPAADPLVVLAACYLHDGVNLPKDHPDRARASTLAAEAGVARLRAWGFAEDKLPAVAHAIAAHSFSAGIAPTTIEARIVQDADRLDALGAVGLARLFYTAGRLGSALAHSSDAAGSERPLDDRAYALDHIMVKLATLPGTMQTAAGRRLGEERLAWLLEFRRQFLAEWGSVEA